MSVPGIRETSRMDRGSHGDTTLSRAETRLDFVPRFSSVPRRLTNFYRGFSYGRTLLREPLAADIAGAIQTRLANRAGLFLKMVEQTIFAHAASPYRPLLDAAGYDLARIGALVHREGVEGALRKLAQDGVYVSIEEFKGIREARRGGRTIRFTEQDFLNPLRQPGVRVSSGATRSRGIVTTLPVTDRRVNAEHRTVVLAAYGLENAPVVIWHPDAPGGLRSVLSLAVMRKPPARWFAQIPGRIVTSVAEPHAHYLGIKAAARLYGIKMPRPTYVPLGQESRILHWIVHKAGGRCVVWTTASCALRLALTAKRQSASLSNVSFVTGSEPLTPAKLAAIHAVGARGFSHFGFTELGMAAYACASPASPDDMHICRDTVAIVQRERPVDRLGSVVSALLFTALQPGARRILVNMESGDYGRVTASRCGCPLEALGWTDHLDGVRSFEKLNAEGWCFLGSHLITLVEETLPARFGGDPTDYQLLEHEDQDGVTRLSVLVHPRVGAIDDAGVLACVERTLAPACGWDCVEMYRDLNILRVYRAAPMLTRAGKLMPLHHLGQGVPLDDLSRTPS
jgi:hypothetical protein